MDKIKELLEKIKGNKKILAGTVAGLVVVVIMIIVIAVSCSKNDNIEKATKENESTTMAKAEKDIADEETTEPETETAEDESVTNETQNGSTEESTTEQPTADLAENITTNVNIQTEPVTEVSTETPTIEVKVEVPPTEPVTEVPTETVTERTTEVAVLPGCENRESSNIIYMGDEIDINVDASSGANVCPFKLYDLNNLATYKYTNGNGYYVTFVGYYGLSCYSDYDDSIMEPEYNYATDIVKSYGYSSLEEFEVAAEKMKTNTAATSRILVGFYQDIVSSFDDGLGGEIDFYGLYMLEY